MALSENARAGLIGVGGAVVAFFIFRGSSPVASAEPIDAIPASAFVVATVDVGTLQRAPLYQTLIGGEGSRMLGMGALTESCGFDPLSRVSKIAIGVPEDDTRGDFGLAAKVNVSGAELEACTKGLGSGKQLETKKEGNYVIVESPNGARLAYGQGLLLVGRGKWLEQMMATLDKKAPSAKSDANHAATRGAIMAKLPTASVVVTAVLPKTLRDRLKSEMRNEVGEEDESTRAFAGVLGVERAAVAVDGSEKTRLEVELVCDTPEACTQVEKVIQAKRQEWIADIRFRIVGLTPVIQTLAITRTGDHVWVSANADSKAIATTLQRVMAFGNRPPPSVSAMPHPPSAPRDLEKP